ncbi:MAG: Cof-type HAD-IIB family hydrolase [Oscillospiraceae bacterium]|nr:Cof-type HAD-IIB family hydrolase [Oscillospiraceae bacterium]MDE7170454.1 Cof-type HAD-IIB family hydrolase [Oscillospiraceae bacterium]
MIRMIALDVDGTLLNSGGTVTEETVLAIRTARERGVRVVLSTGRSVQEAVWLTELAGCDERAVCLGGAAIADMTDGRHLRRWDISEDAARAVLDTLAGQELACMVFAGEANLLDPYSDGVFRRIYPYPAYMDNTVVAEDIAGWLRAHNRPLTKVYALGAPELFPPLLERLRAVPGLELTSSGADNFEVVAQGVDKGRALCLLAEEWGIAPGEIAAIGDSDNDLAMLRAVGCPVAMGNASNEVKASATMVTDSNDRDGAAKAIWKLI